MDEKHTHTHTPLPLGYLMGCHRISWDFSWLFFLKFHANSQTSFASVFAPEELVEHGDIPPGSCLNFLGHAAKCIGFGICAANNWIEDCRL